MPTFTAVSLPGVFNGVLATAPFASFISFLDGVVFASAAPFVPFFPGVVMSPASSRNKTREVNESTQKSFQ